jgi:CBS domain-containing protein
MTPAKHLTLIDTDTPLTATLTAIQQHSHVWITHNDTLAGIITRTDIHALFAPPVGTQDYDKPTLKSLAYGLTPPLTDIMTAQPFTTTPTTTLSTAVAIMKENKINQLAVLDQSNHFIGEITTQHLITRYLTTPPQPADPQQTI